ncbi:MAG: hypothetical protein FWE67_07800 [Planctomycetaceae bacterium]|nr:hypothetical protein [Planctomycetaceae bacterium]
MKTLPVFSVLTAALTALCLTLPVFSPSAFSQQDATAKLKPVLTLKVASLKTIAATGTKIAELADAKAQWNEMLAQIEALEGINIDNPLWLILRSDGNEIKAPILYLPIDNFDKINVPGAEALKSDLKDDGKGNLRINTPLGLFVAVKKKGAYVVTLQEYVKDLPDDPNTLIAGLEKYLLGIKIDFENTSAQSIENSLALIQMFAMMSAPNSGEGIDQAVKSIMQLHKEFASMTFGLTFNTGNADTEVVVDVVPREGSSMAKQIQEESKFKSPFNGFTFNDRDTVFSINMVRYIDEEVLKTFDEGFSTFSDALLNQLEENGDVEEDTLKFVEDYLALIKETGAAVFEKDNVFNAAAALSSDGILLEAAAVKDTGKVNELFKKTFDVFRKAVLKQNESAVEKIDELFKKYVKKDVKTVADFKISTLIVPLKELDENEQLPKVLKDKTFAAYWAVKENNAVAFAAGFDELKTEKALTDALEATKEPAAVKNPQMVIALRPLGVLLKNFGVDTVDDKAKLITDVLITTGNNAKIAVFQDSPTKARVSVNGRAISTFLKLVKVLQDDSASSGTGGTLDRKTIRDF